ncbi:putative integral membrane protein [Acanthocheilonema viteae]
MVENNVLLNNPAMIRLYQIPARHTGIASLCIQLVGLVMSAALTLYLVLHLNDINITRNIKQQSKRPEAPYSTTFISTTMNATEINKDMNLTEKIIWDGNLISDMNGNGTIDETGLQIDLTELIQISAGVYTGMCILWLLSLMLLLASIKLESLDLIIMNSVLLTIAMIYAITHALFVSILFVYHKQVPWTTIAITTAVVLGFALTSIICGFALAFNIAWYRYVVYMNDNDQCLCLSMTAHFFKCHRQQRPTQGYSIPEAVRHSNLPHANELAVHNFSRL